MQKKYLVHVILQISDHRGCQQTDINQNYDEDYNSTDSEQNFPYPFFHYQISQKKGKAYIFSFYKNLQWEFDFV